MYKVLNLFIRVLKGKPIHVQIKDSKTVFYLKQQLYDEKSTTIDPDFQQILYAGRPLLDEDLLRDYDIDDRQHLLIFEKPILLSKEKTQSFENLRCQTDYQQTLRDVRGQPAKIGSIMSRLHRKNYEFGQQLNKNLDDILYLLGLNTTNWETVMQEEFLTRQNKQAITRIMNMGFSYKTVLKAFYECDKIEQNTLDLLYKTMEEDNSSS